MHNIGTLRQTRTRRLAVSLVVAGLAALGVRADVLGAPAAAAAPSGDSSVLGSKVDYIVEHQAAQVSSMQAKGFTDRAVTRKLDNDIVPVGADGSIEVSVWSVAPATEEQRADLAALGASVTDRLKSGRGTFVPSVGLLDAWVPADRLEDLAALAWVAAVTPVSNGVSDAGFGTIVSQGV